MMNSMTDINKWAEKAQKLRKLTGLRVEIDEHHYAKTGGCHLDIPVFITSLRGIGYQDMQPIEPFLAGLFCEEAKELFQDLL